MIQQKSRAPFSPEQPPLPPSAPLTPDTFIFRQMIIDILSHCKKNIKGQPFQDMNVDRLVQGNQNRSIDVYQQYFLIGIGMGKTRELVCNRIQRLIRENIVNKDTLPVQMITGIINARTVSPSGGGSTASSGSNSVVGSASNLTTEKSLEIGKLVSTIICHTLQPSSEISVGLGYLLEGTRNKNNGNVFNQLLEDVYTCLSKYRKKPVDRFLAQFLARIVSQVEYHEAPYFEYQKKYHSQLRKARIPSPNLPLSPSSSTNYKYTKAPSIMQQSQNPPQPLPQPPQPHNYILQNVPFNSKEHLCVHTEEEDAKFGKCFMCDRGANNYDKNLFVPLCSMDCKNRLKRINQQCLLNDHFNFLRWLIQTLTSTPSTPGTGDQIMYSLLLREIVESDRLSEQDIANVMVIVVNNFGLHAIGIVSSSQGLASVGNLVVNRVIENSAVIMSCLVRKYPGLMIRGRERDDRGMEQRQIQMEDSKVRNTLEPSFHMMKVILIQMTRLLESLPINNNSLQLTLLKSLSQILAARENAQQSPLIVLKQLYLHCDCRVLQTNLVERIFNIISQYALFSSSTSSNNPSSTTLTSPSMQNLGTSTTLASENSNTMNMSMGINVNGVGNNCSDTAITVLDEILTSTIKVMREFAVMRERDGRILDVIKEKKVKKYVQSKFVEDFNKKPGKAVDSLRKVFDNKISPRDVALILRENMDYQTKIKKTVQKINKQQVGTYFGTAKKEKNGPKDDFNQEVYWQFLKLLSTEYEGKEVDDCLRITFNSFMMPKEGQQVEVVLGPLSLALEPYLGLKAGNQATATYQLIMVVLMVQTSTNPNVKENQKLKYEGFKKFCADIDENFTEARMLQIFQRVKKRPLEILMEYRSRDVFAKKYIQTSELHTDFWRNLPNISAIEQKKQEKTLQSSSTLSAGKDTASKIKSQTSPQKQQKQPKKQASTLQTSFHNEQNIMQPKQKQQQKTDKLQQIPGLESKNSIQIQEPAILVPKKTQNILSFTFLNLWQFIYMTLVTRNNLRGLEPACILYGKSQLLHEFQTFFSHLYKMHTEFQQKSSSTLQNISNSCKLIILKLAIDFSNCVIGRQAWLYIIKIIYKLDVEEEEQKSKNQSPKKKDSNLYASYEYEASDKLFTRTNTFESVRLKEFFDAMCEFSSSQVKTDIKYTREMYILHHIAEIIQYNLERFEGHGQVQGEENLWQILWPTMRSYFRNMCLHPRRQISMSAIDSYKQLTMKMLKLRPLTPFQSPSQTLSQIKTNHTQLISVYLYIFERSPSYIRDLVINILLNVVCREMRAGWNELYTMLEVADSEDKMVVMKVINRLIRDVGLGNIGNVLRLHQIVLKELRICNDENSYADIMGALWELCEYFGRLDIWLETLSKVKDIYKSSTHVAVLLFFYRVCNRCLETIASGVGGGSKGNSSGKDKLEISGEMENIQDKLQQALISQIFRQQNPSEQSPQPINPEQAHKLIYYQVFSAQMHILEIKNARLFVQSINTFKQLNLDIFFRNIGNDSENKTGFLALWEMFVSTTAFTVEFCYFLNDYLGIVFAELRKIKGVLLRGGDADGGKRYCVRSVEQLGYMKKQVMLWLIRLFVETSKDEVLQLSQEDPDLKKSYKEVLEQRVLSSSKTELIQFYLSSKQYQAKSIQHLVLLKIFKTFYENQNQNDGQNENQIKIVGDQQNIMGDISSRVLEIVLQSYNTAFEVNNKPLLRNFLWHNEFFKGQDYLPGLIKQELRSYELIVRYFPLQQQKGKIYTIVTNFIRNFIQKSSLLSSKNDLKKPKNSKSPSQPMRPQLISADESQNEAMERLAQTLYQDLGLYITNTEQLLIFSLRKLCKEIESSVFGGEGKEKYKEIFRMGIQLSKVTTSKRVLKECSALLGILVDKIY